jgi:two-component system CheB/CheR fusion protein
MGRDARNVIKIWHLFKIQLVHVGLMCGMPYRTLDDRIDGIVNHIYRHTFQKGRRTLVKENRYRRLFESAKDGILILNEDR